MAEKKELIRGRFRSWDEAYFFDWATLLMKAKYVRQILYEPYPFILTEGLVNKYTVEQKLKTKTKFVDMEQSILRRHEYTPDFIVFWTDEGKYQLFSVLGEGKKITTPFIAHCEDAGAYSVVEIKPSFNVRGKTDQFIIDQKSVWDKYEKFVNLIKIEELFPKTFTPPTFLKTPKGHKRTPKWKAKTINQFLNG